MKSKKDLFLLGYVKEYDPDNAKKLEESLREDITFYALKVIPVKVTPKEDGVEIAINITLPPYDTKEGYIPEPLFNMVVGADEDSRPPFYSFFPCLPWRTFYMPEEDFVFFYKLDSEYYQASEIKKFSARYSKEEGLVMDYVFQPDKENGVTDSTISSVCHDNQRLKDYNNDKEKESKKQKDIPSRKDKGA